MTIAVGLLSIGGYVLAADTQETAGPFKTDQRKIATWPLPETCAAGKAHRACPIAGAGYAGYIDRASQDLIRLFGSKRTTSKNWSAQVEDYLSSFYKRHVIPFGARDDLDFSLLIVGQFEDSAPMMSTNRTVIIQGSPALAIGYGELTAKTLLHQVGSVLLDAKSAALLAAYIVYRVKQSVETCGHKTQVVVVQACQAKDLDYTATMKWDAVFAQYDADSARYLWDTLSAHRGERQGESGPDHLLAVKTAVRRLASETLGSIDDKAF